MLDPQQLRTFQEVARVGSYTGAARRLGFTQPAVSYQMRLLERAIGCPLTVRTGRHTGLTAAGTALLRHADQILTAIRVAERDMAHVAGSHAGQLRLAAFPSACATLVPRAMAALRDQHPAIEVRLVEAEPPGAQTLLMRGDADLALAYRYDGSSSDEGATRSPLTRVPLLGDEMRMVISRRHPLAHTSLPGLWPLAEETWFVSSERFADFLQRACARAGFAAKIAHVDDDLVATQSLVAEGLGVGLMPGLSLAAFTHHDVVVHPLDGWPRRSIEVELWPDMLRVPAVAAMLQALGDAADQVASSYSFGHLPDRAVASEPSDDEAGDDPPWAELFRVPRRSLPIRSRRQPDRAVCISNESGRLQAHTWDLGSGAFTAATTGDGGTTAVDISADGESVWWFADGDGTEFGVWMEQPFAGGPARPAVPDVLPGYSGGLALGLTRDVIARSDINGAEVYLAPHRGRAQVIYSHPEFAAVGALSSDDGLVVISHSEHGDAQKPALRVFELSSDGSATPLADLWDGHGFGLWPVAFSPVSGSADLLVIHERRGRNLPLIWDVITGEQHEVDLELAGETSASWYPDGSALLIQHDLRARSELYRVTIDTGAITLLPTPRGRIERAVAVGDDVVEYEWSSATMPHRLLSTARSDPLFAPAPMAMDLPPVDEIVVSGSGGDIHALVTRPPTGSQMPQRTVFFVHGGPAAHDADAFTPVRHAWTAEGFVVVQVNYRGSTGYGAEWRNANIGRPGRAELEDIVAVRDALVANGTSDAQQLAIGGFSWGGYLALLAVGLHPDLWRLGIAMVPVADTAAVYDDMMEEIRASYRVRFGGSPTDVPEAYHDSSPLHVVEDVRAPLLITGGHNDPRCPIRQIELYVERLVELGKPHEFHRFPWGHHPRHVQGAIDEMRLMVDFALRNVD